MLATTVLVSAATVASAEVILSGDARMGVTNNVGTTSVAKGDMVFTNRARIAFTASGETDNGLAFGASLRADNAAAAAGGTAGTVFISGAFGKLSMGDVDDAFGATFGDIAGVGLTGLGDLNELSQSADGGGFGSIPSIYTNGVVRNGDYNSLFTLSSDKKKYTSTTAKVFGFGDSAALVWGPLFNDAKFTASANAAGTGGTVGNRSLTDQDLSIDIDPTGSVGQAGLTSGEFIQASAAGFADAINSAAIAKGMATPTNPLVDPTSLVPYDGFVLAVNSPNKAADVAFLEAASLDYLSFDISTAGISAIPARVLYEYSMGNISVAASYSQTGKNEAYSFSGAYTMDALKVSAGIAKATWDDAITASITGFGQVVTGVVDQPDSTTPVTAKFRISTSHDLEADDLNFGASYTTGDITVAGVAQRREFSINGAEVDQINSTGLSVAYAANGIGATAFVMNTDSSASGKTNVFGLGGSYDLGGGAAVRGGVVGGDVDTVYDLGVSFTF